VLYRVACAFEYGGDVVDAGLRDPREVNPQPTRGQPAHDAERADQGLCGGYNATARGPAHRTREEQNRHLGGDMAENDGGAAVLDGTAGGDEAGGDPGEKYEAPAARIRRGDGVACKYGRGTRPCQGEARRYHIRACGHKDPAVGR
jgi:hypothetical protein